MSIFVDIPITCSLEMLQKNYNLFIAYHRSYDSSGSYPIASQLYDYLTNRGLSVFFFPASGRTEGCVLITKNAWDISPGILLCEEAGCIVTDLEGRERITRKSRLGKLVLVPLLYGNKDINRNNLSQVDS